MERGIFISPAAQSKWWHGIQRGEATSENIARYLANNEPRETWRALFRSYYVILKRLRRHFDNDCANEEYRTHHDLIATMLMNDVREHYNEVTAQIIDKYMVFFNGKEV